MSCIWNNSSLVTGKKLFSMLNNGVIYYKTVMITIEENDACFAAWGIRQSVF